MINSQLFPRRSAFITTLLLSVCAAYGQGTISTIAGNATCSFSGDGGDALVATICGPQGAIADGVGDVYFVDSGNWRIRKIAPNGIISTIAGSGYRGTAGDGGPAVSASIGVVKHLAHDGASRLCFADQDAHKLRCIDLTTGIISGYGTGMNFVAGDGGPFSSASFGNISGVEFVPRYLNPSSIDIYMTDGAYIGNGQFSSIIRRIDGATGIISTIAGSGTQDLRYWNNALYVADPTNHQILKLDFVNLLFGNPTITTVAGCNGYPCYTGDGNPANQTLLGTPEHIAFDAAGNMFFTDTYTNKVRKVGSNGIIATAAGNGTFGVGPDNVPPTQSFFGGLSGLARNPLANGFVIADASNRLRMLQPSTASYVSNIQLSSTQSLPAFGTSVTLIANVTGSGFPPPPSPPTGTVQFFNGVNSLGTAVISGGQAQFTTSTLPIGTNSITATYNGDSIYFPITSAPFPQSVQKAYTTTSITVSGPNPTVYGSSSTLLASVSPSTSTGTIQFLSSGNVLGTASVTNGQAQFTTGILPVSTYSLTAVYSGDVNYLASTASAIQLIVTKVTPAITLVANPSTSTSGQAVTLTATFTPASATGAAQFMNGGTQLGIIYLSGGQAQLTTTALPVGTNSLRVIYYSDGNHNDTTSAPIQQTVNKASTTMTLASNLSTTTFGQAVTLTATLLPTNASGSVQFLNGGTLLGSAVISGGQAQFATTAIPVGTNSITAIYSGDASFLTSTADPIQQTVNKASTTATLALSLSTSTFGQAVTLTATMAPAIATGSVQFLNGSTVLGSVVISGGQAQFTTTVLPTGTNSLTAIYSGDANYLTATSSAVPQTVNKATPTVTIAADLSTSSFGQAVTLTASLLPIGATGSVQFLNGATLLGTVAISGGQAQFTTTALPTGTNSLTAIYSGDANYLTATSSAVPQSVNKATITVTVATSLSTSSFGQAVTLTAALLPTSATGSIQFLNGTTLLGTVVISGGQAQFTTTALPTGANSLTAIYSGDANYLTATSSPVPQSVSKASASIAITVDLSTSAIGQAVTLTATVTPSTASGSVQFLNGAAVLGTATIISGQAQFTTTALPVGTNSLTAAYSGDANYVTITSDPIQQTVNKTATTLTMAATPSTSIVGQMVTLTVSVSPSTASGSVQFMNGGTVLGTATVTSGQAQFTTLTLPVGTNSLTATYGGDATFIGSSSTAIPQVVNPKTVTAATVTSSQNPLIVGASVTFSASVSPTTATGTLQFLDGATVIGTGTLVNGSAAFTTATLTQGTHSITAVYNGDSANAGSTSAVLSQVVKINSGLTMTASPSPAAAGQAVTITATMNSAATGTVQFKDGVTVLATVPVTAGTATYSTSTLAAGSHTLSANYSGDATYINSSTSIVKTILATSSVSIASNANPTTVGQSVTFTALVTPATATGTIQFLDGGTVIGTASLTSGVASFSTVSLVKGTHSIVASYSGDSASAAANSGALAQVVKAVASVTIASSLNPAVTGQSIVLAATVAPAGATGTIQLLDGGAVIGTVTLGSGSPQFSVSWNAPGAHSITVFYSGDASNTSATSAILTQTINPAGPTAPSTLTATAAGANQINLAWTASSTSGVTYNVYSSATSGFTPSTSNRIASGVATTTYSAAGLSPSTTRYYRVTAVNGTGGESSATNQANATTLAAVACHVTYSVTTQWNVGFGSAFSIQNTGSAPLTFWNLTWTWAKNQKVTQSWNSNYSQTGANVSFTNMSYNASIAPGATIAGMGFNASYNGTNPTPTSFYVNGTLCN